MAVLTPAPLRFRIAQHYALCVGNNIKVKKINWILDADIRKFFDSVRHDRMADRKSVV